MFQTDHNRFSKDIHDKCIQALYGALLPGAFVLIILLLALPLPLPSFFRKFVTTFTAPFTPFLTVPEAEALLHTDTEPSTLEAHPKPPAWKTLTLSLVGMLESIVWLALGTYRLMHASDKHAVDLWTIWTPFVVALTWTYAAVRPVARPKVTASYDLFVLYIMHIMAAAIAIGGVLYDHSAEGAAFPPPVDIVLHVLNLVTPFGLALILLSMPIGIPTARVAKDEIVRILFTHQ
jgi:hypothetical protein